MRCFSVVYVTALRSLHNAVDVLTIISTISAFGLEDIHLYLALFERLSVAQWQI
jgi:hypothetical protein